MFDLEQSLNKKRYQSWWDTKYTHRYKSNIETHTYTFFLSKIIIQIQKTITVTFIMVSHPLLFVLWINPRITPVIMMNIVIKTQVKALGIGICVELLMSSSSKTLRQTVKMTLTFSLKKHYNSVLVQSNILLYYLHL